MIPPKIDISFFYKESACSDKQICIIKKGGSMKSILSLSWKKEYLLLFPAGALGATALAFVQLQKGALPLVALLGATALLFGAGAIIMSRCKAFYLTTEAFYYNYPLLRAPIAHWHELKQFRILPADQLEFIRNDATVFTVSCKLVGTDQKMLLIDNLKQLIPSNELHTETAS
jgi:hypothetical protein